VSLQRRQFQHQVAPLIKKLIDSFHVFALQELQLLFGKAAEFPKQCSFTFQRVQNLSCVHKFSLLINLRLNFESFAGRLLRQYFRRDGVFLFFEGNLFPSRQQCL
jgi:hypothetical protein